MLPNGLLSKAKIAAWKLQVRLPSAMREGISQSIFRKPFFPGEDDFVFLESELQSGYVQVAVCRP